MSRDGQRGGYAQRNRCDDRRRDDCAVHECMERVTDDHERCRGLVNLAFMAVVAMPPDDELLEEDRPGVVIHEHTPKILRAWNERRSDAAWEELGRGDDEIGESPAATFRRLRLAMLAAERESFISQRDEGAIDDEVLRALLRGLDLEEAALNRDRG